MQREANDNNIVVFGTQLLHIIWLYHRWNYSITKHYIIPLLRFIFEIIYKDTETRKNGSILQRNTLLANVSIKKHIQSIHPINF